MNTVKKILATASYMSLDVIEKLGNLAANRGADPAEADKAMKLLDSVALDTTAHVTARNAANAALKRIETARAMAARMGVSHSRPLVRREGCRGVFPAITPDDARRQLDSRKGR